MTEEIPASKPQIKECLFGHGTCQFDVRSRLEEPPQNGMTRFAYHRFIKEVYCTPCLASKKVFALEGINLELNWLRELQTKCVTMEKN